MHINVKNNSTEKKKKNFFFSLKKCRIVVMAYIEFIYSYGACNLEAVSWRFAPINYVSSLYSLDLILVKKKKFNTKYVLLVNKK